MQIRRRTYRSSTIVYQADLGIVDSRRLQISCDTYKDAEKEINKAIKRQEKHGEAAIHLPASEMADVGWRGKSWRPPMRRSWRRSSITSSTAVR